MEVIIVCYFISLHFKEVLQSPPGFTPGTGLYKMATNCRTPVASWLTPWDQTSTLPHYIFHTSNMLTFCHLRLLVCVCFQWKLAFLDVNWIHTLRTT